MHPILFRIGQFNFYTHGVMAVFGIIAASAIVYYLAGGKNLKRDYLFDNIIYSVLFGIIGARLTYFFLYKEQFSSWKDIIYIWQGGLVSYGGFIIGAIALLIILRFQKVDISAWLDIFAVALPFGIFFGRLGDMLAGEYFGVINQKLRFDGRVPVTLYEGIWDLFIFILLFIIYKKYNSSNRNGIYLPISVGLYSGGRFIIDFWRDEADLVWNISTGQTVSIILLTLSLLLFVWLKLAQRKERYGTK